MKRVDIKEWKEFCVGDLFDKIISPPVIHSKAIQEDPQGIPYVVRSKFNNGIKCYAKKEKGFIPSPAGTISFGAENATFFYQPQEFISGRDIYYIDTTAYNENVCLFLVSCLRRVAEKYPYNFGLFPELLKKEYIKLPVCQNNEPDWIYMEQKMKITRDVISQKIITLQLKPSKKEVIFNNWKSFPLGQLFQIQKGTRLTKADMKPGNINFIGASAFNNGVTCKIGNTEKLHPANTITVTYNGSVGQVFYQTQEYWASDDVNVLYPSFKLTQPIALFLIPIIKQAGKQYEFIDKWKLEVMQKDEILLPSKGNEPDWDYMTEYMSSVKAKADMSITALKMLK